MYFYGYRQHQPHAFVNKLNYVDIFTIGNLYVIAVDSIVWVS